MPRSHARVTRLRCRAAVSSAPALVWLSPSALRLEDNAALSAAAAHTSGALHCVVVVDALPPDSGEAVAALRSALRARGGDLALRSGAPAAALAAAASAAGASAAFACAEPESAASDAQRAAAEALAAAGAPLHVLPPLPLWADAPAGEQNYRRHELLRGAELPPAPLPPATLLAAAASDAEVPAGATSSPVVPLSEAGASAALDAFVGLGPDTTGVVAAALAADAARPGTSFALLFERALSLGVLSPRRVAARADAALRAHLAGGLSSAAAAASVPSVGRARMAAEAARLSAFHTTLALADADFPGADGLPARRWWRWRGVLVPYVHAPAGPAARPDAPPLLLVHGFGAFGEHWRGNLALADHAAVWAPTLPGFGRSEKRALPYSQALWTEYLADFARHVIRKPAVVAGNSIGGFMAANLAGTSPELVAALVLVNSAGPLTDGASAADVLVEPPPRAPPPRLLVSAFTAALLYYLERNIPATLKRCYPTAPERADDAISAEIFRAACDGGAAAVFGSVFYLPKPPALNALVAAFGKRTLVLQGALDPLNDAKKRAADLARLCPGNASVTLLQAGHCPHDELPAEWNAAVAQLLAEL